MNWNKLITLLWDKGRHCALRDSSQRIAKGQREGKVLREKKHWREEAHQRNKSIFSQRNFHVKKKMLEINLGIP